MPSMPATSIKPATPKVLLIIKRPASVNALANLSCSKSFKTVVMLPKLLKKLLKPLRTGVGVTAL